MAVGRMLKRNIATSQKFLALESNDHRMIYMLILPFVDREGRINAEPLVLKANIFRRLDLGQDDIAAALVDLERAGLIRLYSDEDNEAILEIVDFAKHNSPNQKEAGSDFPGPDDENSRACRLFEDARVRHVQGTGNARVEVEGLKGKGEEGRVKGEDEGEHAPRKTAATESPSNHPPADVVGQQIVTDYDSSEARMHRVLQGQPNDQHQAAEARNTLRRLLGRNFENPQVVQSRESWYSTHDPPYLEATWRAAQTEAQRQKRPALYLFIDSLNGNIPPLVEARAETPTLPPPGTIVEHPSWGQQSIRDHTRRGELILDNGATVAASEVTLCRN